MPEHQDRLGYYVPMHRKPSILIALLLAFLCSDSSSAHPADEVRQVTVEVAIEDDAVTQRIRLPLTFALADAFEGQGLESYRQLDDAEIRRRLAARMAELNPVKIDRIVVRPMLDRVRLEGFVADQPIATLTDAQLLQAGALAFEASYATLGQPPRRVSMTWRQIAPQRESVVNEFTAQWELPKKQSDRGGLVAAEINADGKATLAIFSATEPEYIWHRQGGAPAPVDAATTGLQPRTIYINVFAIALFPVVVVVAWFMKDFRKRLIIIAVGLGITTVALTARLGMIGFERPASEPTQPEEPQAIELFTSLHRNIYRAFDYTDESAIYDALAQSVAGPELAAIYNDVYQSLILRDEGGAVCKVHAVRINRVEMLDDAVAQESAGFKVRCDWEVDGLVQHHGHTHARTNRFEAVYTLAPREGGWRIVDCDVAEQRRTDDGNQTLEDLFDLPEPPPTQTGEARED